MKIQTLVCLIGICPIALTAQTIYDGSGFFSPVLAAKSEKAPAGLLGLSLSLDNNNTNDASDSSGNITWEHSATGHAQVASALIDVQLGATTSTNGTSLIFGRELTATGIGSGLSSLVNQVAGAGVIYKWNSNANLKGLALAPEQVYRITFDYAMGPGLPVDLLTGATFNITTTGVTDESGSVFSKINVADIVKLGSDPDTGTISVDFKSSSALEQLDLNFSAATVADINLLGGTPGNQEVLGFSNLQVTTVPEPSALLLSSLGSLLAFRRRR